MVKDWPKKSKKVIYSVTRMILKKAEDVKFENVML